MLIYNQVTELTVLQLIPALAYGVVLATFLLRKRKFTWKEVALILFGGIVLSLLSALIVVGDYSGSYFRERMGWPLQFFDVWRDAESRAYLIDPGDHLFAPLRFVADTLFWVYIPLAVLLLSRTPATDKKTRILILLLPIGMLLIAAGFSLANRHRDVVMRETFLEAVRSGEIVPISEDSL